MTLTATRFCSMLTTRSYNCIYLVGNKDDQRRESEFITAQQQLREQGARYGVIDLAKTTELDYDKALNQMVEQLATNLNDPNLLPKWNELLSNPLSSIVRKWDRLLDFIGATGDGKNTIFILNADEENRKKWWDYFFISVRGKDEDRRLRFGMFGSVRAGQIVADAPCPFNTAHEIILE